MNAVIGLTELLLEEPLTECKEKTLKLVRTNGDALLSIINDILDFSKMESDKIVLEEYLQPSPVRGGGPGSGGISGFREILELSLCDG